MRAITCGILGVTLLAVGVCAHASLALAEQRACLNCHEVDKKMVGPAFKAVAEKYKSQADAIVYLSEKIAKGGTGVWGSVPMPPMVISAVDAQRLAEWIAKGSTD